MITHNADFPPFRSELKKAFGYLSFQCALVNIDVIGIRLKKTYDIVVILFRGKRKIGWLDESSNLDQETVLKIYNDVPEDRNLLHEYEEKFGKWVEILLPEKNNYVFVSDDTVKPTKNQKI